MIDDVPNTRPIALSVALVLVVLWAVLGVVAAPEISVAA
jgi:hypothetical protein